MAASHGERKITMKGLSLIFQQQHQKPDEKLPAIPTNNEIIFLGDHTPRRKVVLQVEKFSADTKGKLSSLLHTIEDIISSSSNDAGYTQLIEWT